MCKFCSVQESECTCLGLQLDLNEFNGRSYGYLHGASKRASQKDICVPVLADITILWIVLSVIVLKGS